MSHFTVLVIGKDIDAQLAPYAEQDFDEKYAVFNNQEEENRDDYENGKIEVVEIDGQLYSKYADQFRVKENYSHVYKYPQNSILKEVPMKEFYSTYIEYLQEYHGLETPDEKTGLYGYWTNPNAKWDWYIIGGRWSGYFKPKAGASGSLGRPGVFDNVPLSGWVDQIKYSDVDFDGMKQHEEDEANKTYDKVEAVTQGREIPSWAAIRDKYPDNIQAARDEYNNHQVVKDFNAADFHFWGDLNEEFGKGREAYVAKCKNRTAVTYAVLMDGKWYQKGEMGWWGMSSNEVTQDEWNEQFWKLLDSLDPDTELTLVDCHI